MMRSLGRKTVTEFSLFSFAILQVLLLQWTGNIWSILRQSLKLFLTLSPILWSYTLQKVNILCESTLHWQVYKLIICRFNALIIRKYFKTLCIKIISRLEIPFFCFLLLSCRDFYFIGFIYILFFCYLVGFYYIIGPETANLPCE